MTDESKQSILSGDDIFELTSVKVDAAQMSAPTKRVIIACDARRPKAHEFIRVKAGEENEIQTVLIKDPHDGQIYYVAPDYRDEVLGIVPQHARLFKLVIATTRQKAFFCWPLVISDNAWHIQALQAAELAKEYWLKIAADLAAGQYQIDQPLADLDEPMWPTELTLRRAIELAFKDRIVRDANHLVMKRLLGSE